MLLGLFVAGAAHAGATYQFAGADKVLGCSLSGNVYTCSALQLPNWDDKAVIASGYTVAVQSDVSFGYNHGLTMSGTARLTSTGSINLSGLNPSSVVVSGGSFSAGGAFAVTGANPFKANVDAASITLGTGSRLELGGNMVARGAISIGSNTTFTGSLSGTTIGTESPVTLNASIVATASFTLASGSTVKGNITAPEVQLNAAGSVVTGNVTASTSLTMGSSVRIKGAVDTGKLTMQASDATIEGPAAVESAVLFWGGRVTERITCKKGTSANKCDCVDNQSGYPTNSANGPKCEAARPAPSGLDHFLIVHDGSAGTCTSSQVEVSACADAACAQKYSEATQVTLQPGKASASITGFGKIAVSSPVKGVATLSLSAAGVKPQVKCRNRQTGATDCRMEFTGDQNLDIVVKDHHAGEQVDALIRALKPNDAKTACVAASTGARSVQYSCSHVLPNNGTDAIKLNGATCSPTTILSTSFDAGGEAKIRLTYPDAGKMKLSAAMDKMTGSYEFVVAPDHFTIETPKPLRAGQDFAVKLVARNKGGEVTKNFDSASYPLRVGVSQACGAEGSMEDAAATTFDKGEGKASANFSEVGYIGLQAKLTDFLNVKDLNATGATACPQGVGPFLPAYFQVTLRDLLRKQEANGKETTFYYAGEPIPLSIVAMNAKGQVTRNYPTAYGSGHTLTLSAVAIDGTPLAESIGTLGATLKVADYFDKGVPKPNQPPAAAAFKFKQTLTQPTRIRLRAQAIGTAAGESSEDYLTSSAGVVVAGSAEREQARPEIRVGRLRVAARFGRAGSTLKLPVTAEYWSGKSWLLNDRDGFTKIPGSAIAQSSYAPAGSTRGAPAAQTFSTFELDGGEFELPLQSATPGWIDVAVNLGASTLDQSCLKFPHPTTAGANLPWLQAAGNCPDPSGRATFGIFSAENKRVIHVREVFN